MSVFYVDGWRNIAITLIDPDFGEVKAQACAIAWFHQLTSLRGMVSYRAMAKRSALVLLSLAIATSILDGGTKREFPKPTGYVDDFANVLDANTRNELAALCTELDQKTNAQVAVVTVQTLQGSPIENYALRLFNEWGIGHKKDNRGLLILISLTERKYRVEVGRGFETLFPNERVAKIGAEMVPDLKAQNYGQALLRCTRTLASIVAEEKQVRLHRKVNE